MAVFAILKESRFITIRTLYAFVAELAFVCTRAVEAVSRIVYISRIQTVFVPNRFKNQVTIFTKTALVYEVAVLILHYRTSNLGNVMHEFTELFKKRTIEIKVAFVVERIPFIGIPVFWLIDFEFRIRMKN